MNFSETIKGVAEKAGLKVDATGENYVKCCFSLPDGRFQTVHIYPVGQLGSNNIVRISTPVLELPQGTLPSNVAEGLLRESGNLKIGSFCVEEIQGHKLLTLQHNMVLETLDAEEFMIVVGILALIGDQWESKLGGGDRF